MAILEQLGKNLRISACLNILQVASRFIVIPFILARVDKGLFGVYVLVNTFVGYFRIMDFGMTSSIQKYTAEYNARGEDDKVRSLINLGINFYLIVGIIVSIGLFLLSFFYQYIVRVEAAYVIAGRKIFWIVAATSIFTWVILPFREVIKGMQRLDIISKIGILIIFGNFAAVFLMLGRYESFLAYILCYQIITALFSLWFIRRTFNFVKNFKFKPFYFGKEIWKQVVNYSKYAFLNSILGIFIFQFDNLIIGVFLNTSAIAVYHVAFSFQQNFRMVSNYFGAPLVAIASDIGSRNDAEKERTIVFSGTKIVTGIFYPMLIISIIYLEVFMAKWLGADFAGSVLPGRILLFFWFFNNLIGILVVMVSSGKGNIKLTFKISVFVAVANLILSIVLCLSLGIVGIALGTTIPYVIAGVISLRLYLKFLKISFMDFFNNVIKCNTIYYSLCILFSLLTLKIVTHFNVITVLLEMGILYLITIGVYFLFVIDEKEKIIVSRIISNNSAV